MTFYDNIIEQVRHGVPLSIDMKAHTYKLGRHKPAPVQLENTGLEQYNTQQKAIQRLREIHDAFLHSVPNEQEQRLESSYIFKAPGNLTREDVLMLLPRTEVRAMLELTALIFCSSGLLTCEHGWFLDLGKGLIIKKDWLC